MLGNNRDDWRAYDACELIQHGATLPPTRIDQGLADEFLKNQLRPKDLEALADEYQLDLQLHYHEGYDHSYYFIASLIEEQLRFHAGHLFGCPSVT